MLDDLRWGDDPRDRHDHDRNLVTDWRQPRRSRDDDGDDHRGADHTHDWHRYAPRDQDRNYDERQMGRGPGSGNREEETGSLERHHDVRWAHDERTRSDPAREVFARDVHLPRGREREVVRHRDRDYTLRGSEVRTLTTVGAFRVVSSRDLRDHRDRPADPRAGDLRHLREQGLVKTVRIPGHRDHAVVLTKEGRGLLERHRERDEEPRQTFYAGLKRERELAHDVQVYPAYERAAERLHERGARVERVVLDYELKREYQKWLHERDQERENRSGRPDRTAEETAEWAREHDLPYFDDEVHFPDARIEYQESDGRRDHDDIEVMTEHYRGAHAASVARSGFSCFAVRSGGGSGGGRGGGRNGGLAEELWR